MSVNLDFLEDCQLARPNWSPEQGEASPFIEALIAMNSISGYIWLAALVLVLWTRSWPFGVFLSLISVWNVGWWNAIVYNLHDHLYHGYLGGCVGSLDVANALLLCGFLLGLAVIGLRVYEIFK